MQNLQKELLQELKNLVAIDSVQKPACENKPFGEGVYNALTYTLNLCEKFGFSTVNYDNYIGEAIFGEGEPFAILAHLDVVPTGDQKKWKYNPFNMTEENGFLFGRGVLDDKGPLLATLFAMKKLKDEGFKPNKQIKFILGCNEESGWACIKHYNQVSQMPETGFSPDACFPVIYAEKGIFQFETYFNFDSSKLFSICGGVASNVVCDTVKLTANVDLDKIKQFGLTVENGAIFSEGKTAHASEPQLGKNAIEPVVSYLESIGAISETVRKKLFEDELKLKTLNDETGYLTMSPDMISIKNGKLAITVDVRYPSTIDFSTVENLVRQIGEYKVLSHQKPLFNDKNSPLIQKLLEVYNNRTGKSYQPIAIGGGTYARALKLGAGFGPEDDDEPSSAHEPNEKISVKKLFELVDIYYDAIKALTE